MSSKTYSLQNLPISVAFYSLLEVHWFNFEFELNLLFKLKTRSWTDALPTDLFTVTSADLKLYINNLNFQIRHSSAYNLTKENQITKHRTFWSFHPQRYIRKTKGNIFVTQHKTGDDGRRQRRSHCRQKPLASLQLPFYYANNPQKWFA
jgi:hypothetical protein